MLLPLDDLEHPVPIDDASDFWEIMGGNTDYVSAPEECLADNFSYAVMEGLDDIDYASPWLISDIIRTLEDITKRRLY